MGSLFNCDYQDTHASTCYCFSFSHNSLNNEIDKQTNENQSKSNGDSIKENLMERMNNQTLENKSSNRNSNRTGAQLTNSQTRASSVQQPKNDNSNNKQLEENNEEESVQDAPEIIQFHQDKTNDEQSNIVISIDIKHDSVCEGNGQPPTFGAKKPQ